MSKKMLSLLMIFVLLFTAIPLTNPSFALVDAYSTIEAESFSSAKGVAAFNSNGIRAIGNAYNGNYAVYDSVDFGSMGATSLVASVGTDDTVVVLGKIEFWIDDPETGTLIGTLNAEPTGGWVNYMEKTCEIVPVPGVHNVYLKYVTDATEVVRDQVAMVNWFKFVEGEGTPPATGRSAFDRIEAESFTSGVLALAPGRNDDPEDSITDGIAPKTGEYVMYEDINFGSTGAVSVNVRLIGKLGGKCEYWIDGLDTGIKIGEQNLQTAEWKWETLSYEFAQPVTGIHDLYMRFTQNDPSAGNIGGINWLQFVEGGGTSAFDKIEAESRTSFSGTDIWEYTPGKKAVGGTNNGTYVVYEDINFGAGAASVNLLFGSQDAGGRIEFWLDGMDVTSGDALIGTFITTDTGDYNDFIEASCAISGATGVHDLYLKFVTDLDKPVAAVEWFQFSTGTPEPSESPSPTPSESPSPTPNSSFRYLTPEGAGTKDGSSWENALAGNGSGINDAWNTINSSGTLYLGSGTYNLSATISSNASGTSSSSMKRMVGEDTGEGLPLIECDGTAFMNNSADNIWLQDIKVNNCSDGLTLSGKNIRVYNVDISNVLSTAGGNGITLVAAANDVIIKDCDISYCTNNLLGIQPGVYNVRVINNNFENGGIDTERPHEYKGIFIEGQSSGIVFTDCTLNNIDTGCAVSIQASNKNVTFVRTKFLDNGSAVEEFSGSSTFIDCVFLRNEHGITCAGPFAETGDSTTLLYRTLFGYSTYDGIAVFDNAQAEVYNSTIHDSKILNEAYLKLVNSIVSSSSSQLYIAGSGMTERFNTVENTSDAGVDPQYINPSNSWDGEGNNFDSITYGDLKGFYYRGAEAPTANQPQPADFIRTKTDSVISLQGFAPGAGEAIYLTPTGAGTKDGSSWDNAMEGDKVGGLQAAWDAMIAAGAKAVMIGSGNYNVEQAMVIASGGTGIKNMKRILGVDTGTGFPVFTGNFTLTNQSGPNLITLNDGANYIWIQDLKVNNYNQFLQANRRHTGLRIYNVDTNLTRIAMHFEGLNDDNYPDYGSRDTIIMDCDQLNYTIRGMRFRYGNSLGRLINCKSDAGSEANWASGNFPMGFTIGDSNAQTKAKVRDSGFTLIECEANNAWQNAGTNYWNGDGFNSEKIATDLVYFACKAFNNSDGGWDDKAYNPTLIDCIALGNKRNFRFWSEGTAVFYNCLSAFAKNFGGLNHSLGLWTGSFNNPKTEVFNSTLHDSEGVEAAVEGEGSIRLNDCILSSSTDKTFTSGNVALFNSETYSPSSGTDPEYVNGDNQSWNGEGEDFNSTVYGLTKGYSYRGLYKGVQAVNKTILAQKLEETANAVEVDYTAETWAVFIAARNNAIDVYNSLTADQQTINTAVANLMSAYEGLTGKISFSVIDTGTLSRDEGGLKAIATILRNPKGLAHDGMEVVVFQLRKGTVPISMVAMEQDITDQNTFTAYFSVQDPDNRAYTITLYVLSSFSSDPANASDSLADPVIIGDDVSAPGPTVSEGKITIPQQEIDEAGEVACEVPSDLLEEAIEQASGSAGKTVVVKILVDSQAKKVSAVLPAQAFNKAEAFSIEKLQVDMGIATITVTPDTFQKSVAENEVVLSSAKIDKSALSPEFANKVGGKPVYQFKAYVDGKQIEKFNGKKAVEISIDYELAPEEDPKKIEIYYINYKGKLETIKNCKFNAASGKVTFNTNNF